VLLFELTGLLLRVKTAPRLFDCVGKVTATRLDPLVIVPDKVQLTVAVAAHGAVWVMISWNGSFETVMLPTLSVILKRPKVLLPLSVIVAEPCGIYVSVALLPPLPN